MKKLQSDEFHVTQYDVIAWVVLGVFVLLVGIAFVSATAHWVWGY